MQLTEHRGTRTPRQLAVKMLVGSLVPLIMTLFKCQMYLARTALIGDTFQIELEFRNVGFCEMFFFPCEKKSQNECNLIH